MRIRLCEATTRDIRRKYGTSSARARKAHNYSVKIKEFTLDPLYIVFEVNGGTRPYEVDMAFKDVAPKSRAAIKNAIKNGQVKIGCSCPDYKFRFAYHANKDGYGFDTEHRPANITNPRNDKGPGCKHVAAVLNNEDSWINELIRKARDDDFNT